MFSSWHILEPLLGELILLLISNVEINAALENWNEILWWNDIFLPEDIITLRSASLAGLSSLQSLEVEDVPSAPGDHFSGDLDEEASHSLVGVVVSCDCLDHLDTVHESWEGLFDVLWSSIVEWLNESLKGLKILNVILSFIECFSNSKLNASPLGGGKINLVSWLSKLFRRVLRGLSEDIVDGSAVLGSQLLGDTSELSHSLFPVLKLLEGMSILIVVLFSIGTIQSTLDFVAPLIEDVFEIGDHLVGKRL